MPTPAPHEPCCECFQCPHCMAFPPYFSAEITGVQSANDCQDCQDANESFALEAIPCENVGCGWYAFGHCGSFYTTCGDVTLIELRIGWSLVQGVLTSTVGLSIEHQGSGLSFEKTVVGPINCYGPFTFTADDLVDGSAPCDYSQATIVLTGVDDYPC